MNKIDFALVISVNFCNPNGDPLMLNQPRHDIDGYGYMTDVCLKRKIRNRWQDMGENILIVQNERVSDGFNSIKKRVDSIEELNKFRKKKGADSYKKLACRTWIDVRSFGQVFAFRGDRGASISVRGPVSLGEARSLKVVDIDPIMLVRSSNVEGDSYEFGRDPSVIGTRYIVRKGAYVAYGSVFPQLAKLTGFGESDLELLKKAMSTIFENDASAYRPSGSMASTLYWWEHDSPAGRCGSARVHRSINIEPMEEWPYFSCNPEHIDGINLEIL